MKFCRIHSRTLSWFMIYYYKSLENPQPIVTLSTCIVNCVGFFFHLAIWHKKNKSCHLTIILYCIAICSHWKYHYTCPSCWFGGVFLTLLTVLTLVFCSMSFAFFYFSRCIDWVHKNWHMHNVVILLVFQIYSNLSNMLLEQWICLEDILFICRGLQIGVEKECKQTTLSYIASSFLHLHIISCIYVFVKS